VLTETLVKEQIERWPMLYGPLVKRVLAAVEPADFGNLGAGEWLNLHLGAE
jgi:hypothetical protein